MAANSLPPAPAGLSGWPWASPASPAPAADPPDAYPWPRITVVTPSFNQGVFIEETIRSVLLQNYPELEYIVMDGGSTDGTVAVLEKYSEHLAYWESRADAGQSDAINRGFARATGAIGNWLNSDDLLLPGALQAVGRAARAAPGRLICGDVISFDNAGVKSDVYVNQRQITLDAMIRYWEGGCSWHQPGIFFPLDLFRRVGGLDNGLHLSMDYDLYCRLLQYADVTCLGDAVVRFRRHPGAKTGRQGRWLWVDHRAVSKRYWSRLAQPVDRRVFADIFCEKAVVSAIAGAVSGRLRECVGFLGAAASESSVSTLWSLARHGAARWRKCRGGDGGGPCR